MNAAHRCNETSPDARSRRASQRAFFGVIGLLFAISAAVTIGSSSSMPDAMPMPGGWTMSMAWTRMPEESWGNASAKLLGMWSVMMVAMMLPSIAPALWRYRQALATAGAERSSSTTALVGAAYFLVWTMLGAAVFPIGVALAVIVMQEPALANAMPFAVAAIVTIAGALQFTAWKARRLDACNESLPCRALPFDLGTAWRHGIHMGLRCSACCGNLMAILLVAGMMDLRVMAAVTAAIALERRLPARVRAAQVIGAVVVAAGLLAAARATAL